MSPLRQLPHYPNTEFLEHFGRWFFCDNLYQSERGDFSAVDIWRFFGDRFSLLLRWRCGEVPMKSGATQIRLFDLYMPAMCTAKLLHHSQT